MTLDVVVVGCEVAPLHLPTFVDETRFGLVASRGVGTHLSPCAQLCTAEEDAHLRPENDITAGKVSMKCANWQQYVSSH